MNRMLTLARNQPRVQEYEMRNPNPRGAMYEAQRASDARNASIEATKAREMMARTGRPSGGSMGARPTLARPSQMYARPTGRGAGRALPRAARR